LQKFYVEGSTSQNFKLLNVLPVDLLFKKIVILCNWRTKNYEKTKRKHLAYDVKVTYFKKMFGQKFVDSLGLTYFNTMPVFIKKNKINKQKHIKTTINNWLILYLG